MKTKDGIDYQEGMTLYFYYRPEEHTNWHLREARDTSLRDGRVWFTSESGRPGTLGPPSWYYAKRENVVEKIIESLMQERDYLNRLISDWEQQL